jgi:hypothetical protein
MYENSMNAKRIWRISLFAALVFGASPLMAADYSIGIVGHGWAGGTGLNLYSITERGVDLVKGSPYIRQKKDIEGQLANVLLVSMNPAHDFVYVTYTGPKFPVMVGFKITHKGLVEHWEQELQTGDPTLQYTTVTPLDNFVIADTYPFAYLHWVTVFTQSGEEIVLDQGSDFGGDLVSGHIDSNGRFYYSCRSAVSYVFGGQPPATTVVVYDLRNSAVVYNTEPLATSTDPVFVGSICR